jgi:hypothetical protein
MTVDACGTTPPAPAGNKNLTMSIHQPAHAQTSTPARMSVWDRIGLAWFLLSLVLAGYIWYTSHIAAPPPPEAPPQMVPQETPDEDPSPVPALHTPLSIGTA